MCRVPIIHAEVCSKTTRAMAAPVRVCTPSPTCGTLWVIATNESDLMVHLLPIYLPTIRHFSADEDAPSLAPSSLP